MATQMRQDLAYALWRLLPGNPIVTRVVSTGSKRLPHLWTRAAYLIILFLVVLAGSWSMSANDSLSDRAKSATQVFYTVSLLQLAMMSLLAPIFAAGAISQEKDAETYNVLLTTPLTNAQIVLGSLCSRLFFVIALLISGLPIFCITMLFGGVTTRQIFLSFGIAGCTAVLTGSLAIMISVMRVGTRGTIFSFYLGIAMFLLTGFALGFWDRTYVPESIIPGVGKGMSFAAPFHPFLAFDVALGRVRAPEPGTVAHYGRLLGAMLASPHYAYMILTLVLSVAMVVLATFFVRRGIKQGEATLWSRLRPKRRTVDGERRRKIRRVWSNPVAWREAVTRGSAASSNLVRYTYMALAIVAGVAYLWFYIGGGFRTVGEARSWLSTLVLIEFVTVMLMAVNTAATAITRERESGTMELLLTTPLTSRYIIWGKLRGLVSFTVPLLLIPALTVVAAVVTDVVLTSPQPVAHLISAIVLPPLLLVYSALACIIGLHTSLKSKRSVQAVLSSVGILVVAGFGLGLCAMAAMSNPSRISALMAPMTFVTAVWMVLNPDQLSNVAIAAGFEDMEAFLLMGTLLAAALYGAIVAGMYRSMVTNFDMIVRKQSR